MQWFNQTKGRPNKAEVLRVVDEHLDGCGCEADTHTIRETVTYRGKVYEYTITRAVRPEKVRT